MLDNFNTDYPRDLLGIRAGAELYEAESLLIVIFFLLLHLVQS